MFTQSWVLIEYFVHVVRFWLFEGLVGFSAPTGALVAKMHHCRSGTYATIKQTMLLKLMLMFESAHGGAADMIRPREEVEAWGALHPVQSCRIHCNAMEPS